MGIFSRFRDIISSNLNSLLDCAENPEKMVRQMIIEMEDTLIEIKSACAGVMADQKKAERALEVAREQESGWDSKAELAIRKGRDDLARNAIAEKRRIGLRAQALGAEVGRFKETVASFQQDITQLEGKLRDAREKQRSIIARQSAAHAKHQAQSSIRKVDTSEAFMKFEAWENRIDRMEAGASLVDSLRPKESLRDEFSQLEGEDEIEKELETRKRKLQTSGASS